MNAFFGSLLWLFITLGVLVNLHELGHYWAARRFGVRVNRFSFGFGKPLWSRTDARGTEWSVAPIPLGGYVSLLEDPERTLPPAARAEALTYKPKWQRAIVFAAGPLMNLLLCVAFLWLMLVIGRPDYTPIVGEVRGLAAEQGFKPGDRLLSIDGKDTPTWNDALLPILRHGVARDAMSVQVRRADGTTTTRSLDFSGLPASTSDTAVFAASGLVPKHWQLPPVVGEVREGTPAFGVLRSGDRIESIDGLAIQGFTEISPRLKNSGDAAVTLVWVRDGQRQSATLRPTLQSGRPVLGIAPADAKAPPFDTVYRLSPLAAVPAALRETTVLARDTAAMVGRLFSSPAAREGVSGPITIARVANDSAGQGLAWFLRFLALMSLSLAVINLMPVPFLDGGHLLYLLIEAIRGKPMEPGAQMAGQMIGAFLLVSLMGLAFYNDILSLLR